MQKSFDIQPPQKRSQVMAVRYQTRPLTKRKKIILWSIALLVGIAVTACAWYHLGYSSRAFIDGSKYQAVFVSNNQAYFGKLERLSDGAYRLHDVYYLQQSASAAQRPNSDQQTPQLIKLGSELHGPEDAVVFDEHQVLFWENLKSDSKVNKAIEEYKKKS